METRADLRSQKVLQLQDPLQASLLQAFLGILHTNHLQVLPLHSLLSRHQLQWLCLTGNPLNLLWLDLTERLLTLPLPLLPLLACHLPTIYPPTVPSGVLLQWIQWQIWWQEVTWVTVACKQHLRIIITIIIKWQLQPREWHRQDTLITLIIIRHMDIILITQLLPTTRTWNTPITIPTNLFVILYS